jgi:hypothetical protein
MVMKLIIVNWIDENSFYKQSMIVTQSNHPRFKVGTRFDFGFFKIATDEGYTIISTPKLKVI